MAISNFVTAAVSCGGALVLSSALALSAQTSPAPGQTPQPAGQTTPAGKPGMQHPPMQHPASAADTQKAHADMEAKCKAMMAEHERMMADVKAADQKLDTLVATMNAASGAAKADATAAVVTEMVAQRRTHREGMMKMQHAGMMHMAQHMQAGGGAMGMCPMMKMGGMKP